MDAFGQLIEDFYNNRDTEAISAASEYIKGNLDRLRNVLMKHPLPNETCVHLWVKVEGESYWLPLRKSVSIGANIENDLTIDNERISGNHCSIEIQGEYWYIKDLDSTNGVYVNQDRVRTHRLKDGDVIQLVDCVFLFVTPNDDPL